MDRWGSGGFFNGRNGSLFRSPTCCALPEPQCSYVCTSTEKRRETTDIAVIMPKHTNPIGNPVFGPLAVRPPAGSMHNHRYVCTYVHNYVVYGLSYPTMYVHTGYSECSMLHRGSTMKH